MTKQKTRKEREENRDYWKVFTICVICVLLVFVLVITLFPSSSWRYRELKQQFSECQEQVPIEPNPCFKLKEGLSMNTPEEMWNYGEGIVFPRDFIETDCEVIE